MIQCDKGIKTSDKKMEVSTNNNEDTAAAMRSTGTSANLGVVNLVDNMTHVPSMPTINMNNSSDVVIGPLTQYHGPVTIYQYLGSDDGSGTNKSRDAPSLDQVLHNRAMTNGEARRGKSHGEETNAADGQTRCFGMQRGPFIIAASFALLVCALLAFGLYFIVDVKKREVPYYDDIISDGRGSNATLGGGHQLIYRDTWGGVEPRATRRLYHPTPYVVLTHVGGLSRRCEDLSTCSLEMRNMQADHYIRFGSPDIGQNFMVGGDGNVYVGRGWDVSNFHVNSNVVVIFSGDYSKIHATPRQLDATQRLLALGVSMGKLSEDYKLIGHNQSTFTLSPGPNLFSEISKWPHWYNCSYKMETTCGAEINWPPMWGTAY